MKQGKIGAKSGFAFVAAAVLGLSVAQGAAAEAERFIVKFKANKGQLVRSAVAGGGGRVELDLARHDALAVTLPAQAVKGLENNPNVEYVEIDQKRYPLALRDGPQVEPYGIGLVQASDSEGTISVPIGSAKKVCIIDSGFDLGHPDLTDSLVSFAPDGGAGPAYEDGDGHGTHVAGTIAGLDNSLGVVGVNDEGNLPLHIVRVFGSNGSWAYSSSLVAALDACETDGADVINMSLGGSFKSRTEERAFASAYSRGVLSIAAAGNDGNTRKSYPASYDSVVSVAAVDQDKAVASFSQQNDQVELAAPGVGVLSTLPHGKGFFTSLLINGDTVVPALAMQGSPLGSVAGAIIDCAQGDSRCADATGKVCLIERGTNSFSDKVLNCESGGGIGAIIFNNVPGPLSGTLGDVVTSIPSVGIGQAEGQAVLAGSSASLVLAEDDYEYYDGTSMATPHVVGVAALVWSQSAAAACTAAQIRSALAVTAEDLGSVGRDVATGFGLVQARDAITYLGNNCGGGGGGDGGGDGGGGSGGPKCHPKRGC